MTSKPRIDFTSVLGVPVAVGLILLGQRLEGGTMRSLAQPTAALIVFGGTAGAVLLSFSLVEVRRALAALRTVFLWQGEPHARTIETITQLAAQARKSGILSLEDALGDMHDPFMRKAMGLMVDGTDPENLRVMLQTEARSREEYDEVPAKVWDAAGGYAPTVGILGAVIGLIEIMHNLSDPSSLGGGIAVAFVATVYGVGSANLFFLPMGTKLRRKARHEAVRRELMVEGVLSIQEGTSPNMIGERLRGIAVQSGPALALKKAA